MAKFFFFFFFVLHKFNVVPLFFIMRKNQISIAGSFEIFAK